VVQTVQLIHAAGESSPGHLPSGTYAIVLSVPSEKELKQLEQRLATKSVPHTAIREPDKPYDGALMAIGVQPMPRSQVKKHLAGLSLLKEKEKKMSIEVDFATANEAKEELELLQAWHYGFDEIKNDSYQGCMNKAHYKFRSTLMCALIAHSRGVCHLESSLEEQAAFLEKNKSFWEDLGQRKKKREYVKKREFERGKKVALAIPAKKTLLQKLRELF